MTYYCSNGVNCPYGHEFEDDDYNLKQCPAESYSQQPRNEDCPIHLGYYSYGLCLNCLDDHNTWKENADYD